MCRSATILSATTVFPHPTSFSPPAKRVDFNFQPIQHDDVFTPAVSVETRCRRIQAQDRAAYEIMTGSTSRNMIAVLILVCVDVFAGDFEELVKYLCVVRVRDAKKALKRTNFEVLKNLLATQETAIEANLELTRPNRERSR